MTGAKNSAQLGVIRNTQIINPNAINEYKKFTNAVYTRANTKICIGNFTFMSIIRLSTSVVIAALVAPVKSCQSMYPVK